MVEQHIRNVQVEGSIPSSSSNEKAKPTKRVLINGGFDLLYSEGRIE